MAARVNEDVGRVLAEAPAPTDVERRIVQGALQRIESRPRLRVMRVAIAVAVLMAVVIGAMLIAAWPHGGQGRQSAEVTRAAPQRAEPVVGGVWIATAEERHVTIGPHRVELSPSTRLRLTGGSASAPQLALGQGKAGFAVAPLSAGQRFSVQTPQVRVNVLGTRFSLDVGPHCTTLDVSSGQVRAMPRRGQEHNLGGGGRRTYCDAGELDEAGRQLQRALSLARSGEYLGEAENVLIAYLRTQPAGTYAEEARYFLILVKRRLGKESEAVAEARIFLERFPSTARAQSVRAWLEKKP